MKPVSAGDERVRCIPLRGCVTSPLLPMSTPAAVRSTGNARCFLWSGLRSTIHHLAAGRTESTHVLLKAGDYLFWVRDERVAQPEHVRHASVALLFCSLLSCQRWALPEKG